MKPSQFRARRKIVTSRALRRAVGQREAACAMAESRLHLLYPGGIHCAIMWNDKRGLDDGTVRYRFESPGRRVRLFDTERAADSHALKLYELTGETADAG